MNMMSVISKIKNCSLASSNQANKNTSTTSTTTNSLTTITSSSSSDKTGKTDSINKKNNDSLAGNSDKKIITSTTVSNSISSNITSISGNIISIQDANNNSNYGNDYLSGQTSIHGLRSGIRINDHHSSSSSLSNNNGFILDGNTSKNSTLNSSGLSGSLGSGNSQFSSAFPVSSYTETAAHSYSAISQMNSLKHGRNSSVGINVHDKKPRQVSNTLQQSYQQVQKEDLTNPSMSKQTSTSNLQNSQLSHAKSQNQNIKQPLNQIQSRLQSQTSNYKANYLPQINVQAQKTQQKNIQEINYQNQNLQINQQIQAQKTNVQNQQMFHQKQAFNQNYQTGYQNDLYQQNNNSQNLPITQNVTNLHQPFNTQILQPSQTSQTQNLQSSHFTQAQNLHTSEISNTQKLQSTQCPQMPGLQQNSISSQNNYQQMPQSLYMNQQINQNSSHQQYQNNQNSSHQQYQNNQNSSHQQYQNNQLNTNQSIYVQYNTNTLIDADYDPFIEAECCPENGKNLKHLLLYQHQQICIRKGYCKMQETKKQLPVLYQQNKLSKIFDIFNLTGSGGPHLVWKIFSAYRKADLKPASIFYFEKKSAERMLRSKQKDFFIDILRRETTALEQFRHPQILNLIHSLEENSETMAFATEPVVGSLANVLGYLENEQQCLKSMLFGLEITEFEVNFGLLKIVEAISYLHYTFNIIHRNICPQSIFINSKGVWQMAGFYFFEKCSNSDINSSVSINSCILKLPEILQPPIDFSAPECLLQQFCNLASDVYSISKLTSYLYNWVSKSPIPFPFNNFNSQDLLIERANIILPTYLEDFKDFVLKSLDLDHRKRVNSSLFLSLTYFQKPSVQLLHFLGSTEYENDEQKSSFFQNLNEHISQIPRKVWWENIVPTIRTELRKNDNLISVLNLIIEMINQSDKEEVQFHLDSTISVIFNECLLKSKNSMIKIITDLDVINSKLSENQREKFVYPTLISSLNSSYMPAQLAAINTISFIKCQLKTELISSLLIKAQEYFNKNPNFDAQIKILTCIDKILEKIDKNQLLDEVLPFLLSIKPIEGSILMILMQIYKKMIFNKKFSLTVNLIATKILPALIPIIVNPCLKINEFSFFVEFIQDLLNHVTRNQRNRLELRKLSMPSVEKPQLHRHQDQPIGYPHRAPPLRLSSRRTSISVDDVNRRQSIGQYQFSNYNFNSTTSDCNSPDSNFLQVNQFMVPNRRHSDNTIQLPRIFIHDGLSENSRNNSIVNLNIFRRHSAAAEITNNSSVLNTFNANNDGNFLLPFYNSTNEPTNLNNLNNQNQLTTRRYSTAMLNYGTQFSNTSNSLKLYQNSGNSMM